MSSTTTKLARAFVAAASVVCFAAPPADGAEANVIIQGFEYQPDAVEIAPGDTVAWTNLDGTVHTVTAQDHAFDSGRLGQGQRYVLAFNQPGTYPYYCTLHDHQGTVVVSGSVPATSTTTTLPATTTTDALSVTAATDPAPPAPPTVAAEQRLPAPGSPANAASGSAPTGPTTVATPPSNSSVSPGPSPNPEPQAFSVVSAPLIAAPLPLAPFAVIASILALAGVLAAQLWLRSPGAVVRRFQTLASVLTLLSGAVHLNLGLEISYPEPTASLFVAQAATSVLIAAMLVFSLPRRAAWFGIAFHTVSLTAFALSRTTGLFGFREAGWDPSPEATIAVAAEMAGLGLLAIAAYAWRYQKPLRPGWRGAT